MGRWGGGGAHSYLPVPVVEAYLRAEIEASSVDGAFECYEALLRRRRVPHQTVCTQLLELCARAAPRRCVWLLETMGEARGLDVEDYTRILRLFIMGRVSREQLEEFMELALDLLTFPDDGMHAYFAHVTTLLNLELREQVETRSRDDLEVALITHKRQVRLHWKGEGGRGKGSEVGGREVRDVGVESGGGEWELRQSDRNAGSQAGWLEENT